jgi:hypothetical protein
MATHSYGAIFQTEIASVYTALAEVVSFDGPDLETTVSNSFHLTSTDAIKTTIPGMIDPGEARVTLRFTKAQYALFLSYLRASRNWRAVYPDGGSTLTWAGFLRNVGGPQVQEDDTINQEVVIKVTSKPVFVAAS